MIIECIQVCVNYADFLAHTLPANKIHFDKMVVVTTSDDKETQRICEYHNVECVVTNAFYENGDKFNKGKGINAGLQKLSMDGWVVHLDADMYLPPLTRSILQRLDLDHFSIYGIDRMMCPDYESWMAFISKPKLLHQGWVYIYADVFPMGVRIGEYNNTGYTPIGFFQMWSPRHSKVYHYPTQHGSADRTDVQFAKKWIRRCRGFIPEIIAIHLESEALGTMDMGKNWNGRRTAQFAPLPKTYKPSRWQKFKKWFKEN